MPYHDIRDPEQLKALLDAVMSIESDPDLAGVLRRVIESATHLTEARYGALGVLDHERRALREFIHHGMTEEDVERIGRLPEGGGILGLLILEPRPIRLEDLSAHPYSIGFPPHHPPMKTFLGVPIRLHDEVFGNLYLTEKIGGAPFSDEDEAIAISLASIASVAIRNARLFERVAELSMAADRERIARDLHDTVIQRLFASGLSLQSTLPLIDDDHVRERLHQIVGDLDDTIRQLRTAIFELESTDTTSRGVRSAILEIANEAARTLTFEPEVRFVGPIDASVDQSLAVELLSTLREALANVARHARASRVQVIVTVDEHVRLLVVDDGVGFNPTTTPSGHGLKNMTSRARQRGGSFKVTVSPAGGTSVAWRVPTPRR